MATDSKVFEGKNFYSERLISFYADEEKNKERCDALIDVFKGTFGSECTDFFSSPGRIEIVGNHTDHNGGIVLAASVSIDTLGATAKRDDGIIEIKSEDYSPMKVDVKDVTFKVEELGTSTALIKGVLDYYIRAGAKVGGFTACITSNVPRGSGMSSSSSFELIVAEILNVYYNDGKLDPVFKARSSQYAENVYFGKPSGLMDQMAIALGGVNMIDFKNAEDPKIDSVKWDFKDISILVVATGGDHSDLTDDYAAIPADMKSVASALGGRLLRDIEPEVFYQVKAAKLKGNLSERAILRAEHYYEENERVRQAGAFINAADKKGFLDVVNKSGKSSAEKLQNLYSERGDHSLEEALAFAGTLDGVVAKRVHGGGFAGTILVFVEKDSLASVKSAFIAKYGEDSVFDLTIRDSGAKRI